MKRLLFIVLLLYLPAVYSYAGFADPRAGFSVPPSLPFSSTDTQKSFTVSVTDDAVYRTGHYSFGNDDKWIPFNFTQSGSGGWITGGSASKSIPIPKGASAENYIIIYSCTKSGNAWDCHNNQWQIRQFTTTIHDGNAVLYAINSGGADYACADGISYSADSHYSGGEAYESGKQVAGTSDDLLYSSERVGDFSYRFPVVNGDHEVVLKFAEVYWEKNQERIFDVLIEGELVVDDLDLHAVAGHAVAHDVTHEVYVDDGMLDIDFLADRDLPKISAIIIKGEPTGQEPLTGETLGTFCERIDRSVFDVALCQDFEDDTVGIYDYQEWLRDWPDVYEPAYEYSITEDFENLHIVKNTDADQGTKVMRFSYPKGSYAGSPVAGGGGWDAWLDKPYDDIYVSYRLKFKPGFEWVHGGKIPGVRGGDVREYGFDVISTNLLMWSLDKTETYPLIVHYYYYHGQTHKYGATSYWNTRIESGKWFTVTLRASMNTPGYENTNARFEGFIDGKLVSSITGFSLRNSQTIGFDRLTIGSFFGGSEEFFEAARDEWIEFDDFVAFTYKQGAGAPAWNEPSPEGRELVLPS